MDFETYSEAGHAWNEGAARWQRLAGAAKYGLSAVGSAVYAEHPSTEVLSLAYDLQDGHGVRLWIAGLPPPVELFDLFARGGEVTAWNDGFEWQIWREVCVRKMGWPAIRRDQLRDDAAKARAWGLPGALGNAAAVLQTPTQKGSYNKLLWAPRQPTKADGRPRLRPNDAPDNFAAMLAYNVDDVRAELCTSARIPDLEGEELEFMRLTALMNDRGMWVDRASVDACVATLEREYARANAELARVTGGAVTSATQGQRMRQWLAAHGVHTNSLDEEHRAGLLAQPWPPESPVAEALRLFDLVAGAGVRKVYAMQRMATRASRLCNLYVYHGARTGRDTGVDVQPQNLVKAGHPLRRCADCDALLIAEPKCPFCMGAEVPTGWTWEGAEETLRVIREGRAHEVFKSPVLAVSGCIRSLFGAAPNHELICSDYSSIEAVVTACLAGEQWRVDAFTRGDDIYLTSAGKVLGRSLEWYAANGGKKHPDRQKLGKPMELGLGFGGWLGALRQFNWDGTDDEGRAVITGWRAASPAIVEFWGGQVRGKPWAPECYERFGLEGAAINATQYEGHEFNVDGAPVRYADGIRAARVAYFVKDAVLYCRLPSGRCLAYHKPRLAPSQRYEGQLSLSFEGWNNNPKKGAAGWTRMELYGGLLCENVVQATARDILRGGVIALERAGYPIVLRVHDEIAAEVPEGWGSVEEFERLMATVPDWARGWPIKAADGWRGKRYRKE